jgi:Oxygenase domain of the 2OGFeDO superfamily
VFTELRVRTRIPRPQLDALQGKIVTPADYDVVLTGPAKVYRPDGKPLCVYLPAALTQYTQDPGIYQVLHDLSAHSRTQNRGYASGSPTLKRGTQNRAYALPVNSVVAGAVDAMSIYKFCRLTAWTGEHLQEWRQLHPMFTAIAEAFATHVPERYKAQASAAQATQPEWVIPGTPFTTITVNNTWPTGVHTDKGDLEAGFSTITCLRRGNYTGGVLTFPEYRIAADLHDGDLILMDAHDHHGNTLITCRCGHSLPQRDIPHGTGPCRTCHAERITTVAYYRTRLQHCGTVDEEFTKARTRRETPLTHEPAGPG